MKPVKLPKWLQAAASLGGAGLFLVAFLDSSVLSFPLVTDFLVIEASLHSPARMPYYAAMATLGSLAGCVVLYWLAKKGGEAMYRHKAGGRAERIRAWVDRNGFISVALPSILPPPMPFKLFVLAAGVFEVPLPTFVLAVLAGRGFRFFVEGVLAIHYGEDAERFLMQNKIEFALIALAAMLVLYVIFHWIATRSHTRA
jgi:membrane protein YqaA with SNARE-associated domain